MNHEMIYHIKDGRLIQSDVHHPNRFDGATLCYFTQDQFREHAKELRIPQIILRDLSQERGNFRSSLDVYEDASVGYINIINVDDLDGDMDRVMFIIREDLLCLVKITDGDGSEARLFRSLLTQERVNTSAARIFYRFLERLLRGGNGMLEMVEDKLLELEDQMVHGRADQNLNTVLYNYRRKLSIIRNYYEQLVDISSELEENENEIFDEQAVSYFRVLTAKGERLIAGVRSLSENVMHLREMLDAALNYNLNNIMKIFTLITAVFLPLTLIVGWYGMNFANMPELEWEYGYPLVIGISVVIVMLILIFFKRKKLL